MQENEKAKHWVCSWSFAHSDTKYMAWDTEQREISYPVRNNLYGEAVRFRFSNLYGSHAIYVHRVVITKNCEQKEQILTVNQKKNFEIHSGESLITDSCEMKLEPGDTLTVKIIFENNNKPESGYRIDDISVGGLEEMDVLTQEQPKVIVAFGDSITRMDIWTRPLEDELYRTYPGKISFSNKGISGNRLIHDCMPQHSLVFGYAGIKRLHHDVLMIPGLTHVIFALGTNDLGHPGEPGCPLSELPTLRQFEDEVTEVIRQIHQVGAKVIGCTITGRKINPPCWTEQKETLRRGIDEWIRKESNTIFDGILDFEKAIAKSSDIPEMECRYDSGDGLHPSCAGGLKMKEAIPLKLFFGEEDKE